LPVFGVADQCDVESAGSDGRAQCCGRRLDDDPLGLAFAHTQAVAAEFELQRITERRDAEQPKSPRRESVPFPTAGRRCRRRVDRHDAGLATDAEFPPVASHGPFRCDEATLKTSSERKAKFVAAKRMMHGLPGCSHLDGRSLAGTEFPSRRSTSVAGDATIAPTAPRLPNSQFAQVAITITVPMRLSCAGVAILRRAFSVRLV